MNIEELRIYCLSVKGATECFPYDDTVLVFKVMDKVFAYISIVPADGIFRVNLKCNPKRSPILREGYEGIRKADHYNGDLWNSVCIESDVSDNLIRELIDHSVEEVIAKLPKKKREEYYGR